MLKFILVVLMRCDSHTDTACISFQEFDSLQQCKYAATVLKDLHSTYAIEEMNKKYVKFAWCVKK